MRATIVIVFQFFVSISLAAPMPGMGSAKLSEKISTVAFKSLGFAMDLMQNEWTLEMQNQSASKQFRFKSLENNGTLSIRIDDLKEEASLDEYSKKWIRDYPNYGFEILAQKSIKIGKAPALVIDLAQKENQKQIRQVLFLQNQRVVVLTCHNSFKAFKATAESCNRAFNSFKWL
ncbi:MAG: hypothetical protein ACLGGX_01385 [Bdellovibrionia bacterium]